MIYVPTCMGYPYDLREFPNSSNGGRGGQKFNQITIITNYTPSPNLKRWGGGCKLRLGTRVGSAWDKTHGWGTVKVTYPWYETQIWLPVKLSKGLWHPKHEKKPIQKGRCTNLERWLRAEQPVGESIDPGFVELWKKHHANALWGEECGIRSKSQLVQK